MYIECKAINFIVLDNYSNLLIIEFTEFERINYKLNYYLILLRARLLFHLRGKRRVSTIHEFASRHLD